MSGYAIETIGLNKKYGDRYVVDNLELHAPTGKIYGLLGRNGAGKTTAMKMMLNLARPTIGTIRLFGEDYKKQPAKTYRRIGSIIETPGFYDNLTGYDNLNILARLRGGYRKDSIGHALELVGLHKETDKVFSNYSLGMKQRLGIAAAVMHDPELLILDEPINGLDPIGIHEIRIFLLSLCRERGKTILISSHVLSEIEQLADIVGVMHEGRLLEEVDMSELRKRNRQYVEFTTSDVTAAATLLEEYFGISDYDVCGSNALRLYSGLERRGKINSCFVENGLSVTAISVSEEKLEDYFSNLIGGGDIG